MKLLCNDCIVKSAIQIILNLIEYFKLHKKQENRHFKLQYFTIYIFDYWSQSFECQCIDKCHTVCINKSLCFILCWYSKATVGLKTIRMEKKNLRISAHFFGSDKSADSRLMIHETVSKRPSHILLTELICMYTHTHTHTQACTTSKPL